MNVLVAKIGGTFSNLALISTVFVETANNTTVQQAVNRALVTLYYAVVYALRSSTIHDESG